MLLAFLLLLFPAAPPAEVRFLSEDWSVVRAAEVELVSSGAAALPKLIAILDRKEVVPLTNTADLIYPGAKAFYGHGWFIGYDLDRLDVRAGWALEELTFENFGFSEGSLVEATHSIAGRRPAARAAAIARAKKWYAATGTRWSRHEGLKAALQSRDAFRHGKALEWLRHGSTPCAGFTLATYRREILPLVKHLARNGEATVREQAKLLLADGPHR